MQVQWFRFTTTNTYISFIIAWSVCLAFPFVSWGLGTPPRDPEYIHISIYSRSYARHSLPLSFSPSPSVSKPYALSPTTVCSFSSLKTWPRTSHCNNTCFLTYSESRGGAGGAAPPMALEAT